MATDQEIRDAGFKYIPQQKYLQNPFELPAADPVTDQGIVATNAFTGGGGDGFSVYNADPNTITNMNPNMNALQDARRKNELSYVGKNLMEPSNPNPLYSTNTAAIKNMEMYPGYYGMDTIGDRFKLDEKGQLVMDSKGNYIQKNQPSKISELLKKGIGFIPGIGTLAQIGNFASGLLPTNKRAIMENQLGTQGVMVNDIGQIVVGPGGSYNTPEGIMAGYNANQMTDKTFDKRTDTMRDTLDKKYGLSKTQIDGLIAGSLTEDEMEEIDKKAYNKITGRTSDIVDMIRNIEIAKKNFADTTDTTDDIVDIKTDTKSNNQNQGDGGTYIGGGASLQDAGGTYDGYHGAEGGFENTGSGTGTKDTSKGGLGSAGFGGMFHGADGGRAGYFYGGRVNFKNGGLASLL